MNPTTVCITNLVCVRSNALQLYMCWPSLRVKQQYCVRCMRIARVGMRTGMLRDTRRGGPGMAAVGSAGARRSAGIGIGGRGESPGTRCVIVQKFMYCAVLLMRMAHVHTVLGLSRAPRGRRPMQAVLLVWNHSREAADRQKTRILSNTIALHCLCIAMINRDKLYDLQLRRSKRQLR